MHCLSQRLKCLHRLSAERLHQLGHAYRQCNQYVSEYQPRGGLYDELAQALILGVEEVYNYQATSSRSGPIILEKIRSSHDNTFFMN